MVASPHPLSSLQLGKSIVESSKLFVRWMHGSCLECPPQFSSDDEEPFVFSFLEVILVPH